MGLAVERGGLPYPTHHAERMNVCGRKMKQIRKSLALLRGFEEWSVKRDSNPRPSGPKPDALPNCAIHRTYILYLEIPLLEGDPLVRYSQEPDAPSNCAIHRQYCSSLSLKS